jgi:hypothetical protein
MPMALMSLASTRDSERMDRVESFKFSHQLSGSCSAHPGRTAMMPASVFGKNAEATHLPVSASTRLALTEELLIS